jgi:hypothetical protein
MFRIDRISLPDDSPVGAVTIGSATCRLADFDLVIIEGPNGAGKTSIVNPLCSWSSQAVRSWHGDPGLEPSDQDAKKSLMDWLLYRDSKGLMSEFRSAESALASVCGIGRLQEEVDLLKKLVPDSARSSSAKPPQYALANMAGHDLLARSHEVASAIARYEASERNAWQPDGALPIDAPLTLRQYNEWGREAAVAVGGTWIEQAGVDDHAMQTAEEAVKPQTRPISGANDLKAAAQGLADMVRATPDTELREDLETASACLERTCASLERAINALEAQVPDDPAHHSLVERSSILCGQLDSDAKELDAQAKALDALAQLRADAVKVLEGRSANACPICESSIDRDALIKNLATAPAEGSSDVLRKRADALRNQRDEVKELAAKCSSALSDCAGKSKAAHDWLNARRAETTRFSEAITPRDGWDDFVQELSKSLQSKCGSVRLALNPADDLALLQQLSSVSTARDALKTSCDDAVRRVDQEFERRNASVRRAETLYGRMRALRTILVARAALNAQHWHDNRIERRAREQKLLRIRRWEDAIRTRIAARETRIRESGTSLLADPGVQQRFDALVRATGHPLASGATLESSRVVSANGTAITCVGKAAGDASKLSEGLTVILNIAAFFAIAGYVSAHQAHRAGWLLLDEPTNGLDSHNRRRLAEYIGSMSMRLVPKQIFVTTFERDFAERLQEAAISKSDRRVLRIRLQDWHGRPMASPELIPIRKEVSGEPCSR